MTNKWKTEAPGIFLGKCLVTMADGDRRWVTEGWAGKDIVPNQFMMKGAIAWTEIPEHCAKNSKGWLSQYRGDELPEVGDRYLVALMKEYDTNIPDRVCILWFNPQKQQFGGSESYIAWMPLPNPFMGKVNV